jgi:hypothetical protein
MAYGSSIPFMSQKRSAIGHELYAIRQHFLPYSDVSDDFLIADEVNKCTPGIRRTDPFGR